MQVSMHLMFNGTCRDAFELYARVFGGTIVGMFPYGTSPMDSTVPPEWSEKVMHATLQIGDATIAGADMYGASYKAPQGFAAFVNPPSAADAHRIFEALAEGGTVQMPIQETFWSSAFGMLVDRFGIPWEINCETPAATT